jgi:uncharacterized membrane protein (UPF0127 family)
VTRRGVPLGISLALLAAAFLLGVGRAQTATARLPIAPLSIVTAKGAFQFTVEVADTDESRERGLMFRKALAPDKGMLFDFKTPQSVAFWMKDTLIPLDMLFVARDGRIIAIARQAAPLSQTPIPSGGEVLGVVELRGGRAAEIGAVPGDRVVSAMFSP